MLVLVALLQAADAPVPSLGPLRNIIRLPCADGKGGEVVVCGGKPNRYRPPYPIEREGEPAASFHVSGDRQANGGAKAGGERAADTMNRNRPSRSQP